MNFRIEIKKDKKESTTQCLSEGDAFFVHDQINMVCYDE